MGGGRCFAVVDMRVDAGVECFSRGPPLIFLHKHVCSPVRARIVDAIELGSECAAAWSVRGVSFGRSIRLGVRRREAGDGRVNELTQSESTAAGRKREGRIAG